MGQRSRNIQRLFQRIPHLAGNHISKELRNHIETEKIKILQEVGVSINHETNNALAIIMGNAEILLKQFDNKDHRTRARIEAIHRQAVRIANVVNNVCKIKKITHTKYYREIEMVNLNDSL